MVSIGHTRCPGVLPIPYKVTVQTIPKQCIRLLERPCGSTTLLSRKAIFEQLMVSRLAVA